MARKREISFFTDIQSDEEFENFLDQNNWLALDVYQEMYGPCVSLHSTLERKKVSLSNSDSLQLATCNSEKIEKLKRFRGKSLPTILFCKTRKVLLISYGSKIPQVMKMIEDYFSGLEEGTVYPEYDFDELLPFEMEVMKQKLKAEAERKRIEYERVKAEKFARLDNIIDLMNKNSSDMGITLFMPHVAKDAFRKTHETAKWLSLANRAGKMIQITPDMMETLNYNLENPIDERILEEIYHKDIFAVLWYMDPRSAVTDVLKEFVSRVTEPQEYEIEGEIVWETILDTLTIYPEKDEEIEHESLKSFDEDEDDAEVDSAILFEENSDEKLSKGVPSSLIAGPNSLSNLNEEVIPQATIEPQLESESEPALKLEDGVESDGNLGNEMIVIPPVWTPANQSGNAIFMHEFFRNQFESFLPPVIEPEPPHICMIFPAKIRNEVLEVCEEYPKDLLNYGFFEGENFDDFRPLCKSVESFEELMPTKKEKMILKVAKRTSLLALDLVKLNPLYVSHNVKEGQDECSMLFEEEEQDEEN